jgi:hypothetical protein
MPGAGTGSLLIGKLRIESLLLPGRRLQQQKHALQARSGRRDAQIYPPRHCKWSDLQNRRGARAPVGCNPRRRDAIIVRPRTRRARNLFCRLGFGHRRQQRSDRHTQRHCEPQWQAEPIHLSHVPLLCTTPPLRWTVLNLQFGGASLIFRHWANLYPHPFGAGNVPRHDSARLYRACHAP